MTPIIVVAIPTAIAEAVRVKKQAPVYNHPTQTTVATGYGPCRHCLRKFVIGEDHRTLFTYNPFSDLESAPLPGPVFIHAGDCDRYPEGAGYPEDLRSFPVTLIGYERGRRQIAEAHLEPAAVDAAIERFFDQPEVDYVHVRDRSAGCYDFRIERDPACARIA